MTDKTANTQTSSPERAMQRRESVTVGQIQWDGGKPWCDTCRKRLDSMVGAISGKRLTYERLTA